MKKADRELLERLRNYLVNQAEGDNAPEGDRERTHLIMALDATLERQPPDTRPA